MSSLVSNHLDPIIVFIVVVSSQMVFSATLLLILSPLLLAGECFRGLHKVTSNNTLRPLKMNIISSLSEDIFQCQKKQLKAKEKSSQ